MARIYDVVSIGAVTPCHDEIDASVKGIGEDVIRADAEKDFGGVGERISERTDGPHVGGYSAETVMGLSLQERRGICRFGVIGGSDEDRSLWLCRLG